MSEERIDQKAEVRKDLDLSQAEWVRVAPEDAADGEWLEYARVRHTDGVTYTGLRTTPDGPTLVFTPSEWDAFVKGAKDGEFDLPQ